MKTTSWRLIIVALIVSVFAIGMSTLLNYFKFRTSTAEMLKSRVLVVSEHIDRNVVASLSLGLSFSEIPTLPALIETEKDAAESIQQIIIFDTRGKTLYSTDKNRLGKTVDPNWIKAAAKQQQGWLIETSEQRVTGRALRNSFDLTVGYVALIYTPDNLAAANEMGKKLFWIAATAFLLATALVVLFMPIILRRVDNQLQALTETSELRDAVSSAEKDLDRAQQALEAKSS